jgi:hypothetical protein
MDLTRDHTHDYDEERERVVSAGGFWDGTRSVFCCLVRCEHLICAI